MSQLALRHMPQTNLSYIDRSGILMMPYTWPLIHKGKIKKGQLAYRLRGPDNAPVIVVLGGISSHKETEQWWPNVVGHKKCINTEIYRVLSFDFLGGNGQSSAPEQHGKHHPHAIIDTKDQAIALNQLLNHLQINCIHSFAGASYGGMIGLAFAELYPEKLRSLIILCAAHTSSNQGIAWRSIQRQIIRLGIQTDHADAALALARALAMTTYRTPKEFEARFSSDINPRGNHYHFEVEDYLKARGGDFIRYFSKEAFLCLSESIDLHRVDPKKISTPLTCIGFNSDQLVPSKTIKALSDNSLGESQHFNLPSLYGHDAFLKETILVTSLLNNTLETLKNDD